MAKMTMNEKRFNKFLARESYVQTAVREGAYEVGGRARKRHAPHRDKGHSRVTIKPSKSKVDWYITLTDERGQQAAAAIEYGFTDKNGVFHDGTHTLSAERGIKRSGGDRK